MVDWSHGPGRFAADHLHLRNIKAHAQDLAIRIDKLKRRTREQRVYLVGHSAGCLVVLLAAQTVSEDSVDRIILLAPSVSTTYDLRPALRSSRLGIDVFYSRRDVFVLGLGMAIFGTSDRRWSSAAGRVGFRPLVDDPGDRVLYAKLRQHEWHPERAESGHNGGHWGGDSPGHVHTYILPLLKDR
jgi:pimeloyl-ACP methyl ester carboxylesterase